MVVASVAYSLISLFMYFHDTVNNRNISIFYLKDHNLSCSNGVVVVGEEENVSSLEGRFHRATNNDHRHTKCYKNV